MQIIQAENQKEMKRKVCQAMLFKYLGKLRAKFERWKKQMKIGRLTESNKKIRKHKIHVLRLLVDSWLQGELKKPFQKWKGLTKRKTSEKKSKLQTVISRRHKS
jgi:hypothetical protein